MIWLVCLIHLGCFPDGSLIFGCTSDRGIIEKNIAKWSGDLAHVAIILNNQVYESAFPITKKTPLNEWILKYNRSFYILCPRKSLSIKQIEAMLAYANSQIGRRYMARGLWQNKETRGTFCSQYVGEILEQGKLIKTIRHKETPQSLYTEISDLYFVKSSCKKEIGMAK